MKDGGRLVRGLTLRLGGVWWRLTALQVEGMEALQVPKFVAVDFTEALVELVVWEVAVGVRVPDMAARLDVIWPSQWRVCFRPRRC